MLEHISAWMLSPQLRIKSGAEASAHVISVSLTACPPPHPLPFHPRPNSMPISSIWTSVVTQVLSSHTGKQKCIYGCTFELSHPLWGCDSQTLACINIIWGLVKPGWLGPNPRVSDSAGMRRGLRVCISNKFTDAADAAGLEPALWKPLERHSFLSLGTQLLLI